jgi:hypothetical protein
VKIYNRQLTQAPKAPNAKAPVRQAQVKEEPSTGTTLDTVDISSSKAEKNFKFPKLATLAWGAAGALVASLPIIGPAMIGLGATAVPRAIATEENKPYSLMKSVGAGAAGILGGVALSTAGLVGVAATGSALCMLPVAALGAGIFGYMAQIDSTLGPTDLFG